MIRRVQEMKVFSFPEDLYFKTLFIFFTFVYVCSVQLKTKSLNIGLNCFEQRSRTNQRNSKHP